MITVNQDSIRDYYNTDFTGWLKIDGHLDFFKDTKLDYSNYLYLEKGELRKSDHPNAIFHSTNSFTSVEYRFYIGELLSREDGPAIVHIDETTVNFDPSKEVSKLELFSFVKMSSVMSKYGNLMIPLNSSISSPWRYYFEGELVFGSGESVDYTSIKDMKIELDRRISKIKLFRKI